MPLPAASTPGPMEISSSTTNRSSPMADAKVSVMEVKDVNDSKEVRGPTSKVVERGSCTQMKIESWSAVV